MHDLSSSEDFQFMYECSELLDEAAQAFSKMIGVPRCSPDRVYFEKPNVRHFVVLRCIRIVSGLRAALSLLATKGYFQEAGVLCRMLLEFSHDIELVFGGFLDTDSQAVVDQRISSYFDEKHRTQKEWLSETNKAPTIRREKIYAAIGRLAGGTNPHRTRQIVKSLEDAYSGYTHGNYLHTMEMYDMANNRFSTSGAPERVPEWLGNLALIIHPILNQFSTVASLFDQPDLEQRLIEKRIRLERASIYTSR